MQICALLNDFLLCVLLAQIKHLADAYPLVFRNRISHIHFVWIVRVARDYGLHFRIQKPLVQISGCNSIAIVRHAPGGEGLAFLQLKSLFAELELVSWNALIAIYPQRANSRAITFSTVEGEVNV